MSSKDVYRRFETYGEAKAYIDAQEFNPYISHSGPHQLVNVENPNDWYVIDTYWPAD